MEMKTPVEEMLERQALKPNKPSLGLRPQVAILVLFITFFIGFLYWSFLQFKDPELVLVPKLESVKSVPKQSTDTSIIPALEVEANPLLDLESEIETAENLTNNFESSGEDPFFENIDSLLAQLESNPETDEGEPDLNRLLSPSDLDLKLEAEQLVSKAKAQQPPNTPEYFDEWEAALRKVSTVYIFPFMANKKRLENSGSLINETDSELYSWFTKEQMDLAQAKRAYLESLPPKPYNGWSFQKEMLAKAPDFQKLYQPGTLNETQFRNYISFVEDTESGYVITHNFLSNISTYRTNELGESVQGSAFISIGQTPREAAEKLLRTDYNFNHIDARTYQYFLSQIERFSDVVMNQSQVDWIEQVLRPEIESTLVVLPLRIRGWRQYDTSSVPGSYTHSYYHDDYKQTIKVTFQNRSYAAYTGSPKPEMINGFFWYKNTTLGAQEYLFFPKNSPTHKISFQISSVDDETNQYSVQAFDFRNHFEFIEHFMQKYGTRQLEPYSWEFWAL
jgi:hypothetical protein